MKIKIESDVELLSGKALNMHNTIILSKLNFDSHHSRYYYQALLEECPYKPYINDNLYYI